MNCLAYCSSKTLNMSANHSLEASDILQGNLLWEKSIEEAIRVNIHKSPGPDGIYPRMLKELIHKLAKPLYSLFKRFLGDCVRMKKVNCYTNLQEEAKESQFELYTNSTGRKEVICHRWQCFVIIQVQTNNALIAEL